MHRIPAKTASSKSSPMLRRLRFYRGWWIVAAGFLCQMTLSSSMGWIFSFLILPMEKDLGWSRAQLVGVLTVAHLLNGVVAALLGPMVDRHGPRWFMVAGALLSGSCLMLVSYVAALWQYYLILGVGLAIAEGSLHNLGPVTAIANWFVRKRAQAFTVSSLGSSLSGILVVPAVTWLVSSSGWRAGWIAMGMLIWFIVPLAFFAVRRRPEDVGLLPDGDYPGSPSASKAIGQPDPDSLAGESIWTVHKALRSRTFWLIVVSLSLYALANNGLFIHFAPFLAEKGLSAPFVAMLISSFGLAGLASRLFWGYAVARFGIRPPFFGYGVIFGLGIILFVLPASNIGIFASTLFLGFSAAGWQLFQSQVLPDYFSRLIVGSLMGYAGIFLTVARSFAPLFAALLHDSTHSYVFAFTIFALAAFVGAAAVVLAPSPRLRSKQILVG